MKTKLITTALGLLLALAGIIALPAPASAHNYDAYSTWNCAATRPGGTTLAHSWPYELGPGYVNIWCRAGLYGSDHQWFIRWYPELNRVIFLSSYQKCNPGGIVWCGWPPAH